MGGVVDVLVSPVIVVVCGFCDCCGGVIVDFGVGVDGCVISESDIFCKLFPVKKLS